MTLRASLAVLALLAGGAAMVVTSGMSTLPPPLPPVAPCKVSGTKHLTPPLSEAAACERFMAGIAAAPAVSAVAIEILPQGLLKVIVTRTDRPDKPGDFALAVSDRAMTAEDLDRLAEYVVAELAAKDPR